MRSRMPFPDPILPIAIIAMVFASILPLCMRKEEPKKAETIHQEDNNDFDDPFFDSYDPERSAEPSRSVVIKTKFVEVTSGTEELGFDWLIPASDDSLFSEERRK